MKGFREIVGATAAVAAVTLAQAGCWVALHDGFGKGDLYALAFWALPFGGVIGMASIVLKSTAPLEAARARRGLIGAALGALLGLLWTLLMAQMMGPWFGALSFPVLPFLASSGALTLALVASYPPAITRA